MSNKPAEQPKAAPVEANVALAAPVTTAPAMSEAALMQLIKTVMESSHQSTTVIAEKLAEALKESNKPYKDPAQEANEEQTRETFREMARRERANLKASQDACDHIAGCNVMSEAREQNGKTSIIWHKLDTTEIIGICTVCQRIFRENDRDYTQWRQKPSYNRPSAGGERQWNVRPVLR